jgi:hypothetical protein
VNKLLAALSLVLAGLAGLVACGGEAPSEPGGMAGVSDPHLSGDAALAEAYEQGARNHQVEGRGTVVRLLDDDLDGSRHQRFIVRLASGQTLLIAHNIDIAPRVRSLRVRDSVTFFGEYEWNEEGGTIHWTHHDPNGQHVAGWIRHRGRTYQ